MFRILIAASFSFLTFTLTVSAHERGHYHHAKRHTWELQARPSWPHSTTFGPSWTSERRTLHVERTASASAPLNILPHPEGCPRTAFCGCGVAVKVFGTAVRNLWLAANWLHFPRTSAHAGAVAVFGRHHVAYIEQILGNGMALLYDPNSGGHMTREHARSIAGATIVEPRA